MRNRKIVLTGAQALNQVARQAWVMLAIGLGLLIVGVALTQLTTIDWWVASFILIIGGLRAIGQAVLDLNRVRTRPK